MEQRPWKSRLEGIRDPFTRGAEALDDFDRNNCASGLVSEIFGNIEASSEFISNVGKCRGINENGLPTVSSLPGTTPTEARSKHEIAIAKSTERKRCKKSQVFVCFVFPKLLFA